MLLKAKFLLGSFPHRSGDECHPLAGIIDKAKLLTSKMLQLQFFNKNELKQVILLVKLIFCLIYKMDIPCKAI